jgi:hypothetical protein
MKAAYPLLLGIGLTASAFAQNPVEPKESPEVSEALRKAIEEFNRHKKDANAKANEVVVVLEPPAPPAEASKEEATEADALTEENAAKPILANGNPPVQVEADVPPEEKKEELSPETVVETEDERPAESALEVRVESIRKGIGSIDPRQVKLKARFPAKPLSTAPAGWLLERSEQAPVYRKDVDLQPGTTISLSIRPHVLSPDSDGMDTFSVGEPGFNASQGYIQKNTVSAILGTSVAQLDRDSLQLGNAISELHHLLASLPQPEEPEQPETP